MTQVVLQEDRLQIGARCVGMNPVRFGHNSCSRHRGGTPPSAAELTTRMHSRQRVAHHRLRVAIRQRSESPTLRAKSIASPVGPCILRCRPAGFSSRRHESAGSRLRSWGSLLITDRRYRNATSGAGSSSPACHRATLMLRDLETYCEQARGCVPCRAIGGAGRMRRHARRPGARAARPASRQRPSCASSTRAFAREALGWRAPIDTRIAEPSASQRAARRPRRCWATASGERGKQITQVRLVRGTAQHGTDLEDLFHRPQRRAVVIVD